MKAGIALGSNVGDRLHHLREARREILALPNIGPECLSSSVYETAPVGCEPRTRNFLNAVIQVGFEGRASDFLQWLRQIETEMGRAPEHKTNAPRIIDLDLLFFGEIESSTAELQLPHPRLHERRFVLQPLADICPALVLAGRKESVSALLAELADASAVRRATEQW
jgi:2-amino-4-hydroxy-6-hydroxymethyldihydropteridine diphosphokinase